MVDRIIMAPDDKINKYREEVKEILEILGHPEALVTDESTLSDFPDKYIWRVAQKIREIKEEKTNERQN